ncbi:MAG: hypothetical protein KDA91_09485 [Planctomycetaceae bacterium]|nr:hypothetical protein [Planctomycetaceae bacterium]
MGIIYLQKLNNDVVSHCSCEDGRVSFPGQMDCPWCGCGWLFSCVTCCKAFTFAKGVELDATWEEVATEAIRNSWEEEPTAEDVASWVEAMQELLECVEVGETYVYLDGAVIPADVDGVEFEGWHSLHKLDMLPQVEAIQNPSIVDDVLANKEYWMQTALPDSEWDDEEDDESE